MRVIISENDKLNLELNNQRNNARRESQANYNPE